VSGELHAPAAVPPEKEGKEERKKEGKTRRKSERKE
jgi:hypothetical protein